VGEAIGVVGRSKEAWSLHPPDASSTEPCPRGMRRVHYRGIERDLFTGKDGGFSPSPALARTQGDA
jgi:hypothetical protein